MNLSVTKQAPNAIVSQCVILPVFSQRNLPDETKAADRASRGGNFRISEVERHYRRTWESFRTLQRARDQSTAGRVTRLRRRFRGRFSRVSQDLNGDDPNPCRVKLPECRGIPLIGTAKRSRSSAALESDREKRCTRKLSLHRVLNPNRAREHLSPKSQSAHQKTILPPSPRLRSPKATRSPMGSR